MLPTAGALFTNWDYEFWACISNYNHVYLIEFILYAQSWANASISNEITLPCVYEIAYPCLKSCSFSCWLGVIYTLSSRQGVWQHLLTTFPIAFSLEKNEFWLKFLFVVELCNWQDVNWQFDGLMQYCSFSIANTLEILQSSTKPSNW